MATEDPTQQALRTLRTDLRDDLERFLLLDPQFFAGYVHAWLVANLELEQLEHLVDELDDVVRVDGHRLLDWPASGHER